MKRIIAIILVLSTILSLSGCSVSFDKDAAVDYVKGEISDAVDEAVDDAKNQASEAIDNAIEDGKEELSDKVNGVIDGIIPDDDLLTGEIPTTGKDTPEFSQTEEAENTWLENALGYDMTITFQSNGGVGGPTYQRFKGGSHIKITDEKPTKEGYHFVGWTRLKDDNKPYYYAGLWTNQPFSQNTTLYACWEAYDKENPLSVQKDIVETLNFGGFFEFFGGSAGVQNVIIDHSYSYDIDEGKIVRIHCDCGFELIDRDISLDNFVYIKSGEKNTTYDSLKQKKKAEYYKEWVLYRTQDFAPVAIALISSFYECFNSDSQDFDFDKSELKSHYDSYNYDAALSSLGDFFDTLKEVSDFEAEFAKSKYAKENVDLKFTYYDHNCNGQTIAQVLSQMRTEDVSKPYREFANEYFDTISKGSKYASTAIGIGRAIYYGYDAFGSDKIVTERTLSMVKAIHAVVTFCPAVGDYYDNLFSTLEEGLELYDKCYKYQSSFYALLSEILEGTIDIEGINLSLLDVDQARIGNFDGTPSVAEVLVYLIKTAEGSEKNNYSLLSKDQKTLVIWYLTMRLEYDFYQEYGITLEDYKGYIK